MSQFVSSRQFALMAFVWNRPIDCEALRVNDKAEAALCLTRQAVDIALAARAESRAIVDEEYERWDGLS